MLRELEPTSLVLMDAVKPRRGDRAAHRQNVLIEQKRKDIANVLGEQLGVTLPSPDLPMIRDKQDLITNNEVWAEKLQESLLAQDCGKINIDGKIAVATYYENVRNRGIMNDTVLRERHVHRLYNWKLRKWPYGIDIPRKGRKILDELERVGLGRHAYIMTGDLIGENREVVNSWQERALLGKAVDATVEAAKQTAAAVADTIENVSNAVGDAFSNAESGLRSTYGSDPIICLGNTAIWGWT